MNIRDLMEGLIKEFANNFLKEPTKSELCDFQTASYDRIYVNLWKKEALDELNQLDFECLSCERLANWFVLCGHALCEHSNGRDERDYLKICKSLRTFPPREALLSAVSSGEPTTRVTYDRVCEEMSGNIEKVSLTEENIVENFKFMLEMEDVETLLPYLPIVQLNVELINCGPRHYRAQIQQANNGQQRFREVVSPKVDEVVIVPKKPKKSSMEFDTNLLANRLKALISRDTVDLDFPIAFVKEVSENAVIVNFLPKSKPASWSNPVDLVFRPTRFPIRYQSRGLSLLAKNEEMRRFLFPNSELAKPTLADHNNNILFKHQLINQTISDNPEQLAAVSQIATGSIRTNAPFIIFGPPGTGKTTTIVESILQLRLQQADSRILVTSGSNSACDTVALRICEYFKSSRSHKEYYENETALPLLRIYSKSILDQCKHTICDDLRRNSNVEWLNGEHSYPAIEDIQRYGIVVATLCTVGKLVCADVNVGNFFTHIFIDEAGAASEPETLVGIMGIKNALNDNCRVILSGDHKQLGPVLKSAHAIKLGLDKSLMQRLLESADCYAVKLNGEYDQSLQIRLVRNYRAHPEIMGIYNRLYYNGELVAMAASNYLKGAVDVDWPFLRNSNFPIAFHAIWGSMHKRGTTSSCNYREIFAVIHYVTLILQLNKFAQADIGVITPYRLQSDCIKKEFSQRNWHGIEVGSVENFQGREKTIVIASMVRSKHGLGFVRSCKRFNVLLSRAKALLIVIGKPKTLNASKDIKYVIESCKFNGNYFTAKVKKQ